MGQSFGGTWKYTRLSQPWPESRSEERVFWQATAPAPEVGRIHKTLKERDEGSGGRVSDLLGDQKFYDQFEGEVDAPLASYVNSDFREEPTARR